MSVFFIDVHYDTGETKLLAERRTLDESKLKVEHWARRHRYTFENPSWKNLHPQRFYRPGCKIEYVRRFVTSDNQGGHIKISGAGE